jgi:hypothetical protein
MLEPVPVIILFAAVAPVSLFMVRLVAAALIMVISRPSDGLAILFRV